MFIELIQLLQHNRIKGAQKFSAFLLLYSRFCCPANSEETMTISIRIKLGKPFKEIKKKLKNTAYSFCANLLLISYLFLDNVAPSPTLENHP